MNRRKVGLKDCNNNDIMEDDNIKFVLDKFKGNLIKNTFVGKVNIYGVIEYCPPYYTVRIININDFKDYCLYIRTERELLFNYSHKSVVIKGGTK